MGKIIHIADAGKGAKIAAVDAVTKSLQSHLNGIAAHFDHPLITLIVRTEKGGDLIMTNDTAAEAIGAIARNEVSPKAN